VWLLADLTRTNGYFPGVDLLPRMNTLGLQLRQIMLLSQEVLVIGEFSGKAETAVINGVCASPAVVSLARSS